jgi:phosphoribosylformylglycinamidine synthase
VVRIHGTKKALAFTSDVTPRYCFANPVQGGRQAVAEAFRNLCATGARPLATTDNMNFGNPEKPEIMGQFVGCIQGIGEACLALDMPIVSGNVSLYNETDGTGILPTPTIGAIGLLDNLDQMIGIAPNPGDAIVLIGETTGWLGQSAYLADLHGIEDGDAPPVDLIAERAAGELVRAAKAADLITAAHDISDGGMAVAAAEMAFACGTGIKLASEISQTAHEWFFGEDQGRYLLACKRSNLDALLALAKGAGVPARHLGKVEGDQIVLSDRTVPLATALGAWRNGFSQMMG